MKVLDQTFYKFCHNKSWSGLDPLIKIRTYTERQSGSEVTTIVRRIKRGRIFMKGEKLYLKNSKGKKRNRRYGFESVCVQG